MVYILFFYDMMMTMANVAICVAFALLFVFRKDLLHFWLAVLFGLSTVDVVLMYLFDFIPDFQMSFGGVLSSTPFIYFLLHIAILLAYRFIAGYAFDKRPVVSETSLWIICCTCVLVTGLIAPVPTSTLVGVVCIGLLQFYITWIGISGLREKREDSGILGDSGAKVLVVAFTLCSLGYLAYAIISFFSGGDGPRNLFIEVSGGVNIALALWYFLRYTQRQREQTAAMAVPAIAVKYGLTKREEEMLLMLIEEMSNQQIGSSAFISVGTVKAHAHNIYVKLGIRGRSELSAFVKKELDVPADRKPYWISARSNDNRS